MDPARISLEDDRRGLSGLAFRFGNRVTYLGLEGDAPVWRVELFVAPTDELQLVETDERGAKASRQPAPGEMFDALELISRAGQQTHAVIAAFALTGVELRAGGAMALHELAALMREAAADDSYPMPLRLLGDDRPLHLSDQGRRVLRQLADALEQDGRAMATLPAVKRLEVAPELVDALRKRVRRDQLQAYRVGDQWFVVLDNLPHTADEPQAVDQEAPTPAEPPAEPGLDEAAPQPVAAGNRLPDSSLNGSAKSRLEASELSEPPTWAVSEPQRFEQAEEIVELPEQEPGPVEPPAADVSGSVVAEPVPAAPQAETSAWIEPEGASEEAPPEERPRPQPEAEPVVIAASPRRALYGALASAQPASEEPAAATGLVDELRGEVDFLRRQMQEKDRQITAWITETRRKDVTLTRLGSRLREPSTGAGRGPVATNATRLAMPDQAAAEALLQPWLERLREMETRLVRLEGVAWAVEQTPEPWTEAASAPWYRRLLGLSK